MTEAGSAAGSNRSRSRTSGSPGGTHEGLRNLGRAVFVAVTILAVVALLLAPRLPQDPAYHDFADARPFLGVPNGQNVLSNIPFLIVGLSGLLIVGRRPALFLEPRERWSYLVFFAGIALTSIGSSYYHIEPSNWSLLWDRLPITIGFMGLFAALLTERVRVSLGIRLLPILLLAGFTTVIFWYVTETAGVGDLRPYLFVQIYPMLMAFVLVGLFPARYTRGGDFIIALGLYMVAAFFDYFDRATWNVLGFVGGHALKHLFAAAGAGWLLLMLLRREPTKGITRSHEDAKGAKDSAPPS